MSINAGKNTYFFILLLRMHFLDKKDKLLMVHISNKHTKNIMHTFENNLLTIHIF